MYNNKIMATMLLMTPNGDVVEVAGQQSALSFLQVDLSDPEISSGAGGNGGAANGGMSSMIWIILGLFVIMMLFARPRQDKEGEKFRNSLQREQDVVTSSGIFGKIKDIDEISVILEVAQGMRIKVDKRYINPVPVPQPAKPEKKRKKKDPSKDEKA